MVKFIKAYLFNLLITLDQSVNTIAFGDPDETISSRAGRVFPNTWWSDFIDAIMFWQTNHCHKAIEKGEGKKDLLFPRR